MPNPSSVPPSGVRPLNHLLAALPSADFERLRPDLKTLVLRPGHVLHYSGERMTHVYFPNGGVFSIVTVLPEGTAVEAATVGVEGMLGIQAFFGGDPVSPGESVLQVPDTNVTSLSVDAFRRELDTRGALYERVGLYAEVLVASIIQAAACNLRHHVEERCAKWLLLTDDRMGQRKEFRLSHEFLAMMIGAARPTVTAVERKLQEAGLITYTHGRVSILDRKGLEARGCSCYPILQSQFSRLLGEN